MPDTENNRRNELCSRFRSSLASGSTEYFDEDDLIEIFDYAGDLHDDYLRFEALLCGARYYPDSVPLKQRRALLYAYYDEDSLSKFLHDNSECKGAIWDITRIRNANPVGSAAAEMLDNLLASYDEFEDEEIIQLVNLASQLGQNDWLITHLGQLKARVSYLPTLLFELAVVLEMSARYDDAIKYLEELTDIDPYNEQYWFMLAQEHDLKGNRGDALQALDLALAILPSDRAMRFYHARLLSQEKDTIPKAIEELENLAADCPDDVEVCHLLATLYIDSAPDDINMTSDIAQRAVAVIEECLRLNPGNRKLVTDMLALGVGNPQRLIASVDHNEPSIDVSEWLVWADQLHDLNCYDRAIDILLYYENKLGAVDIDVNQALIINYFLNKEFDKVCERFETQSQGDSSATPDKAALVLIIYAVSLAKERRYKEASEFGKMMLQVLVENGPDSIEYSLRQLGIYMTLTDLIQRLRTPSKTDWTEYDPFGVW